MQQFRYAGYTICYERLADDATPIALGVQADEILALVCRPPGDEGEAIHVLLEVQVCLHCPTLQRQEKPDGGCLLCGGALDWAKVWDGSPQV